MLRIDYMVMAEYVRNYWAWRRRKLIQKKINTGI